MAKKTNELQVGENGENGENITVTVGTSADEMPARSVRSQEAGRLLVIQTLGREDPGKNF